MKNYSRVQFIGYEVNTFPGHAPTLAGRNPNNPYNEKYLGHDNSRIDIDTRCKIMSDAIYRARRSTHSVIDGNTLKIFMAPEFYFRGNKGVYPIEEVSRVMEKMRVTTKQTFYNNWFFVFGTALGYLKDGSSKEIFNIALVQRGGTTNADKDSALIVYKEYISPIDFISKETHLTWDDPNNRKVIIGGPGSGRTKIRPTQGSMDLRSKHIEPVGRGKEKSKSGLGGQSIFKWNNIMFGLEVCLDHAEARLRSSRVGRGSSFVQIQLIPSAGMDINDDAVATATEGLIFNVDATHVELKQNNGNYANPNTNLINPAHHIDLDNLNSVQFIGNHNNYFEGGKGSVYIYTPINIPKAKMSR